MPDSLSNITLTFDGLTYIEYPNAPVSYEDQGFVISNPTGVTSGFVFGMVGAWGWPTTTTLTQANGQPFNVSSIDLSEGNDAISPLTITFTGTLASGETITQTYVTSPTFAPETVNLSGFNNLVSFAIYGVDAFDNIVVDSSPTPPPQSVYYLTSETNWDDAQAQAQAMGGNLATINDAIENQFLANAFSNAASSFWIGYTDQAEEGVWQWISGETSDYTNWDWLEPNGGSDENHLQFYPSNGYWNDNASWRSFQGIVEVVGGISSLSVGDVSVAENSSYEVIIPVTLKGITNQIFTVDYSLAPGTATENQDYTLVAGTLTFNPGDSVQYIVVSLQDDDVLEGNETFFVNLSNVTGGAVLDQSTATVTIAENEKYTFTYTYGNGDSYSGHGYALAGTYTAGQVFRGYSNETGKDGYYTIDSVEDGGELGTEGLVYVTSYTDDDTGFGTTTSISGYYWWYVDVNGDSGLGSESGYAYNANNSGDNYFSNYSEADLPGVVQVRLNLLADDGGNPGELIANNQIGVNQYFFVEILVADLRGNAVGVNGLGLDLAWDGFILESIDFDPALAITPNFPLLQDGSLDYDGFISNISGGSLPAFELGQAIGVNQLERFALLRFYAENSSGESSFTTTVSSAALADDASYSLDVEEFQPIEIISPYRQYNFTYHYGNGDSYTGYVYAQEGTYTVGQTIGYYPNETSAYPAGTGAVEINTLGYSFYGDSVYHFTYTFTNASDLLTLYFKGSNLQGIDDESWGLDNVKVTAGGFTYTNDFETDALDGWSSFTRSTTPIGSRNFLGEFGNDTVSLSLNNLDLANNPITLEFDLFILKSWDGNNQSYRDFFTVQTAEGQTLLNSTFANVATSQPQTYPDNLPGYYKIDSLGETTLDSWYNDQVYVTSYTDGDTGYGLTTNIGEADYPWWDGIHGYSGLGSESGYAYDTNGNSYDSYFSNSSEADIFANQKFNYTYHYGNGDSYTGYVFAAVGTYTKDQIIGGYSNETGFSGYYTIDSVELGNTNPGYNGYVYITSYTDGDTSYAYGETTNIGEDWWTADGIHGYSGLGSESGSESGYAYTAEGTSHDSYFSNYYEADLTVPSISITDNSGDIFDASIKFTTELSKFRKNYSDSDFVRPNYADSSKYFDITNTGTAVLTVSGIQINVAGVTTDLDLTGGDLLLNPNESQRVQLTYTAAAAKEDFNRSDALVLFTDAVNLPEFAIALSGKSTFNSDINYDGKVNTGDLGPLNLARKNYNQGIFDPTADINGDGLFNNADVLMLQSENKSFV